MYIHLRPPRAARCKGECVADCPRCEFHAQLEQPIGVSDEQRRERVRERADAILRGEIPR